MFGLFNIAPDATPEQIARNRQIISSMMPDGRARYVGEGLADLAGGIVGGLSNRRLNEAEDEGRAGANDLFASLVGGGTGSANSFNVLGMPQAASEASVAPQQAPQGDMASRLREGMVSRGLPEHVAEGFLMNFQDESGLDPGINEANPIVPGSRGGFGLYQLTGPRRVQYERFADARGVPYSDVDAQLDFMMQELQGSESAAGQAILSAQDTPTAAAAIVNRFLRPAEEHRASREARYLGGQSPSYSNPQVTMSGRGGGVPVNELASALANPWLSQEQRAVLQGMMTQQQANSDPLRQLQIQRAQVELEQMRNPTRERIQDATGRWRYTDDGSFVFGDVQQPEGYTILPQDEVTALGLPTGSYQRGPDGRITTVGGTGPSTVINMPGQGEVGTIPQGYELFTDPDSGARQMRPISGGPEDDSNPVALAQAQQSLELMDMILENPELDAVTGFIQGRLPPRTQAQQDLLVQIDQLQGQAFMQAFETLKGGGQITEREGAAATAAIARLNRVQSAEAYRQAISELRAITEIGIRRANGETVPEYGGQVPSAPGPQASTGGGSQVQPTAPEARESREQVPFEASTMTVEQVQAMTRQDLIGLASVDLSGISPEVRSAIIARLEEFGG